MIDITVWIENFTKALEETFSNRICFIGLQGSYSRDEATDTSDIDMVVILDTLSLEDIQRYASLLDTLPHRELTCGFLSGKEELMNWEISDLFQFYHDTKPIKGNLEILMPEIDKKAINRAIKSGVCNIYHACVHNLIYEKNETLLKELYKSASFVIQAIWYQQSGEYVRHQQDLLHKADDREKKIISAFLSIKNSGNIDFESLSNQLFEWSKYWINQLH